MRKVRVTRAGALVLCALLGAIVVTAQISPGLAAGFAPFFLLVGLLAIGHFPGEEMIDRLRSRYRQPARRPASSVRPAGRVPFVKRVGRAAAFALAVRPPPALLLTR